ncbi:hypothetical protein JTB14_020645 [Gonioctena quinquepunctata]|nr:hypothetical protein JTB14_020645 [Gonioctena quinquepunctata]
MNLDDGACWQRIKQSGNFKRKVANRYAKIIKNNSSFSLNQLNGSSVGAEREGNHLKTYEENTEDKSEFLFPTDLSILPPSDIATDQGANNNTDEDGINHQDISVFEQNIRIHTELRVLATTFNINHSALKALFKILNQRIPNILPNDPRTLLTTPKRVDQLPLVNVLA